MSIVSEKALDRLYELKSQALSSQSSYESKYQFAIRGLEAAIVQLEQVKEITSDTSINLTKP